MPLPRWVLPASAVGLLGVALWPTPAKAVPRRKRPSEKTTLTPQSLRNQGYSDAMIERILRVQPYVLKYAKEFGVDPALVNGIIRCESGFRPNAISPAGAVGLTQIMPGTKKGWSKQLGVSGDLMDPEFSIRLGTYGISKILRNWKGDVDKALAAYNWGGGNLQKHGLEAAPKKTHGYIKCVKRHQKKFQRAS